MVQAGSFIFFPAPGHPGPPNQQFSPYLARAKMGPAGNATVRRLYGAAQSEGPAIAGVSRFDPGLSHHFKNKGVHLWPM